MKKYVFRKYNPDYIKFFKSEKAKIKKVLGEKTKIEHIGSSAITGLGGKGIVDIVIGTAKSKIPLAKNKLAESKWEFRAIASKPKRLFFRADYPYKKQKRRVHLHLVEYLGQEWQSMINFRDYLKSHPNQIIKYEKIKKAAVAKAKGDGEKYRKFKEGFITEILKKSKSNKK